MNQKNGQLTPLLAVDSATAGYGDLTVVRGVSLHVHTGSISAVMGRNGAGKTTLLRAVAGLNRLVSGTVYFDGVDISRMPAHRRVRCGMAYVQEGKRVFRKLTVEQNLIFGGYSRRLSRQRALTSLGQVLDLFPVLAARRREVAGALSGGQQQMLAIGQALMAQPKLLLIDEPSGGLAPAIVAEVFAHIRRLRDAGIGVLLVEQAVEAMVGLADDMTVLSLGKVAASGPVEQFTDTSRLRDLYFRKPTT